MLMRTNIALFVSTVIFIAIVITGCAQEVEENKEDQTETELTSENENNLSSGEKMSRSVLSERLEQLSEEEREKILSGGPPPDGIPSIDAPNFTTIADADNWLEAQEPIIFVRIGDEARAYPMQILMWHEIVNDRFGGIPITVTYCPLCNSSFTFDRRVSDQMLDFGTTGYLYGGALLMYDRQSHTLWAHFGGTGLAGPLANDKLEIIPSSIISWSQFKEEYPDGEVLSKETGFSRNYGQNPYIGYDNVNEPPFLFSGHIDDTLAPKERIVAVEYDGKTKAYLLEDLQEDGVIHDDISGRPVVLFYQQGTASGLDASSVAGGKDVGSTFVYFLDSVEMADDAKSLTFSITDEGIYDRETNTEWNVFGDAIAGPLKGEQLEPVAFKLDTFWFAWSTYEPDTEIYKR